MKFKSSFHTVWIPQSVCCSYADVCPPADSFSHSATVDKSTASGLEKWLTELKEKQMYKTDYNTKYGEPVSLLRSLSSYVFYIFCLSIITVNNKENQKWRVSLLSPSFYLPLSLWCLWFINKPWKTVRRYWFVRLIHQYGRRIFHLLYPASQCIILGLQL